MLPENKSSQSQSPHNETDQRKAGAEPSQTRLGPSQTRLEPRSEEAPPQIEHPLDVDALVPKDAPVIAETKEGGLPSPHTIQKTKPEAKAASAKEKLLEQMARESPISAPQKESPRSGSPTNEAAITLNQTHPASSKPHVEPEIHIGKEKTWIKSLRTYRGDVAELFGKQKQSLTRIVIAEKKKQEHEITREENKVLKTRVEKKNILVVAASIALFLLGGGAIYFAIQTFFNSGESVAVPIAQTLIFTEEQKKILLNEVTRSAIERAAKSEIANTKLPLGNIVSIHFTKQSVFSPTSGDDTLVKGERFIDLRELLAAIAPSAPAPLIRSLDGEAFLYGVHSFTDNYPFLILKTNSFEIAFSDMLRWEETITRDLAPLFNFSPQTGLLNEPFKKDVVIKNQDARVLRNQNGNVIFLYAFTDRKTIVMTTNVTTFEEIVRRLQAPKKVTR